MKLALVLYENHLVFANSWQINSAYLVDSKDSKKKKKYNWLIVEEAGWLVKVLEVPT